jgi:hypothetical protein
MSRLTKLAKGILTVGNYTPIDDIIINYPDGVIVNGIIKQAAKNQDNAFAFTFIDTKNDNSENTNNPDNVSFFFAESGDLKKLISGWLDNMSLEEIKTELKENPVTIKIYKIKTRNGRDYVKATVIDEE